MLKHFPFGERFDAGMGGRSLAANEALLDVEASDYLAELTLKRSLLQAAPYEYFRAPSELRDAEWEVLERVLLDLAEHYPDWFRLERQGSALSWDNRLLGEQLQFSLGDRAGLPLAPLDWVGRQVQEDLVLVRADETGTLVGGQLCFPNGWDIPERVGLSFLAIHQPTPSSTMPGVQAGARLLRSLKPDRTFCRVSWNLKLTSQLDLSSKYRASYQEHFAARAAQLDQDSIGRELFIRVERQTFTRLKSSPHVLFGIHTYLSALETECADAERARRIHRVVSEAPEDVRRYKAIGAVAHALFPYLESKLDSA